jgi:putative hemolysin
MSKREREREDGEIYCKKEGGERERERERECS